MSQVKHLSFFWGIALIVSLSGCATGDIGDEETPCTSDSMCSPDTCDIPTGKCVARTATDVQVPDVSSTPDMTMVVTPDMGADTQTQEDMSTPVVCTPTCAGNQTCVNGTCVSACMPACEAPALCTANGCQIPACASEGAACDPATPSQGAFVCADLGDGEGVCFNGCSDEFSADTCDVGNYCLDLGETAPLLGCAPSLCEVDSECGTGTCVRFDNDFGLCFTSGAATEGATCSSTTRCAQGLFCDFPTTTATSGVCRELCDPFTTGSCGAGRFCGEFVSAAQGLCTSNQSTLGTDPFDTCNPSGSWCADRTRCTNFGNFSACLAYCRGGGSDCDGVLPDGSNGVCDNYIYPGDRTIGACFSPCDPLDVDPCGPGAVCVDAGVDAGKCRATCTVASLTADCCGGTTPCNFECINGLCE